MRVVTVRCTPFEHELAKLAAAEQEISLNQVARHALLCHAILHVPAEKIQALREETLRQGEEVPALFEEQRTALASIESP